MSPERPLALAIDAGGTYFKSALVDAAGEIVGAPVSTGVDSHGASEVILNVYGTIIKDAWAIAARCGRAPVGIGVATPGPFDYDNGTSLMTHKFQSLRGINLARALQDRHAFLKKVPFHFAHDAHAFIAGEQWKGAARGWNRVAGITLGTGIGFGAMIGGTIHDNGAGGPCISLYGRACRDGILEDVVSRRGIVRLYRERRWSKGMTDLPPLDVAEIARRAMITTHPDTEALATFLEVGDVLGEHLIPVVAELQLECLVFGGQIAKSFRLLEEGLRARLDKRVQLRVAEAIDNAALVGVARFTLPQDSIYKMDTIAT